MDLVETVRMLKKKVRRLDSLEEEMVKMTEGKVKQDAVIKDLQSKHSKLERRVNLLSVKTIDTYKVVAVEVLKQATQNLNSQKNHSRQVAVPLKPSASSLPTPVKWSSQISVPTRIISVPTRNVLCHHKVRVEMTAQKALEELEESTSTKS